MNLWGGDGYTARMRKNVFRAMNFCAAVLLPVAMVQQSLAWGHDGHSLINRTAEAALPADVPAFLKTPYALDAVAFYAPEPDHWREKAEPVLYAELTPEHFVDLEIADILPEFPRNRYDYVVQLSKALPAHPELLTRFPGMKLPYPDGVGLLIYEAVEGEERLKNTMRTYRALVAAKQDTKAIEAEIIFEIGILGHFVADGSQPLHATVQYNGWYGPNPNGYTTDHKIHSAFEGDFVHNNLAALQIAPLVPVKPTPIGDVFADFTAYIRQTNSYVEKTYQLYKAGAFDGAGTPAGKDFTDERLAAGAAKLRDMVYTAWVRSGDPVQVYTGN